MSVKLLAIVLLLGDLLSVGFMTLVLIKQVRFLKGANGNKIVRNLLFFLALNIFIGSIITAVIDVFVIFFNTLRSQPSWYGVVYALARSITIVLSSVLLWAIYKVIEYNNHRNNLKKGV